MDSIKDLLKKRADKLDLETKRSELDLLQEILDRYFKNFARVVQLKDGVVQIKVTSSAAAGEVRMQQVVILEEARRILGRPVTRLHIKV